MFSVFLRNAAIVRTGGAAVQPFDCSLCSAETRRQQKLRDGIQEMLSILSSDTETGAEAESGKLPRWSQDCICKGGPTYEIGSMKEENDVRREHSSRVPISMASSVFRVYLVLPLL